MDRWRLPRIESGMDGDLGYFLIIVFGLPLLLLVLTGPGMWSEKWGWGALVRLERLWKRVVRRERAPRPP